MARPQLIELIEAAYDLGANDDDWSREVASRLGRYCGGGDQTMMLEFDTKLAPERRFLRVTAPEAGRTVERALLAAFRRAGLVQQLEARFGPPDLFPPVARLTQVLGGSPLDSPIFAPFVRLFGFADIVAMGANDGSGHGLIVNLPSAGERRGAEAVREARRALPHLCAALRLRRALAGASGARPGPGGAVMGADGRLLDGDVPAPLRERLREAVLARDSARTARGRQEESSLDGWTALVEGRWSLVDVFEENGRRYVVAHPNLPDVLDPRHLAPLERAVFSGLSRGLSNKAMGYELGLAEGTIAGYVRVIRQKLGEAAQAAPAGGGRAVGVELSGVELVALVCEAPGRDALDELSPAERAVLLDVLAGRSNAEAARSRNVSPRTIANQLASAYRKLGVGSRRDLLSRLRQER